MGINYKKKKPHLQKLLEISILASADVNNIILYKRAKYSEVISVYYICDSRGSTMTRKEKCR